MHIYVLGATQLDKFDQLEIIFQSSLISLIQIVESGAKWRAEKKNGRGGVEGTT